VPCFQRHHETMFHSLREILNSWTHLESTETYIRDARSLILLTPRHWVMSVLSFVDLSSQRAGFNPEPPHVRFGADKSGIGTGLCRIITFTMSVLFHLYFPVIRLSISGAIWSYVVTNPWYVCYQHVCVTRSNIITHQQYICRRSAEN
jgi:hypothetical protein